MQKDSLLESDASCCVRCGAKGVQLGNISRMCEPCTDRHDFAYDNGVREATCGEWCPPHLAATVRERLPGKHEIIEKALAWRPTREKSIAVLHGVTGKGKSRLLCLMLFRMERERKLRPKVWWAGELGAAVAEAWMSGEGGITKLLRESGEADILAFDDFDKVKVTERLGEFLFAVIDARIRHGRPTVITTNLTGPKLQAQFSCEVGPALLRRIKEHGLGFAP